MDTLASATSDVVSWISPGDVRAGGGIGGSEYSGEGYEIRIVTEDGTTVHTETVPARAGQVTFSAAGFTFDAKAIKDSTASLLDDATRLQDADATKLRENLNSLPPEKLQEIKNVIVTERKQVIPRAIEYLKDITSTKMTKILSFVKSAVPSRKSRAKFAVFALLSPIEGVRQNIVSTKNAKVVDVTARISRQLAENINTITRNIFVEEYESPGLRAELGAGLTAEDGKALIDALQNATFVLTEFSQVRSPSDVPYAVQAIFRHGGIPEDEFVQTYNELLILRDEMWPLIRAHVAGVCLAFWQFLMKSSEPVTKPVTAGYKQIMKVLLTDFYATMVIGFTSMFMTILGTTTHTPQWEDDDESETQPKPNKQQQPMKKQESTLPPEEGGEIEEESDEQASQIIAAMQRGVRVRKQAMARLRQRGVDVFESGLYKSE
jgi:vacuolar-type H+-ATPase subunit H